MVIPTGTSVERKNVPLLDNELQTIDSKWGDRPARLQHRFLVLRKLGQGTYGKVQLALNKETNKEVAIKTIKKARIESEEDMLRIRREIHIMKSIRHPYIIHIHDVFETRQKIVIVMQYANGGELYDYLGCHNILPEEEARRIFRQIVSAIYYCHKNKICHRDLKLENILLDDVGNAQIADFGLSNIFDDRRRMNTFCGSPLYASPEIVKGTPYKGPEVDCWSLGVLLYTLIYGTMPFDGRNFKDLVSQISEGRYEEPANKSSASSLIRRLLTPDISRRATITDVCQDNWVNQGYNVPLLNIADKMAWDAAIKTKNLSASTFELEKNGHGKINSSSTTESIKKQNAVNNDNTPPENLNSINGQLSRNSELYEQILNYDVSFVINKLLVAVESSVGNSKTEIPSQTLLPSTKENGISSFKTWPQNGESNVASKVESAYVIPIFEVTSVVPKNDKIIKNQSKENSEQSVKRNSLPNGVIHKNSEAIPKREIKNKLMTKRKELSNDIKLETSVPSKVAINTDELSNAEQLKRTCGLPIIQIMEEIERPEESSNSKTINASNDMLQIKRLINRDNSFNRMPSVKTKRANENYKFASKHLGPFFRTTNHALSLARIFSLKYEKLVRTSIKLPERKKLPGKIVIPSTFDPSTASNVEVQERKQIVLFPTVSVSENKEKIEKKIEKIRKAALNMNLVKRSSSKNRLKIQKYLLSQAKKIQDLICDEQRSANGSMEQLSRCEVFPNLSETYHSQFEKGNINAFSMRQHNKRMNFMYPNAEICSKNQTFDFVRGGRMKMFPMTHISTQVENNLGLFTLTKSKSDVQFPSHITNSNESYDSLISSDSSFNKHYINTLSIPFSDCSTRLQRSASDSEGLNIFRNAFENNKYEEYYDSNKSGIEISYNNILNPIFNGHSHQAASEADFNGSIQSTEEIDADTFKNSLKTREIYNDSDGASKKILRSNSISICEGLQNANSNYYFIMKQLSTAPTLEKSCGSKFNSLFSKEEFSVVEKLKPFQSTVNEMYENQCELVNQKVIKRRNSIGCVPDSKVFSAGNNKYCNIKSTVKGSETNGIDFNDNLWAIYKEQLTHQKNESNFLSSPNLYGSPFEKKLSCDRMNDSKSIDYLNCNTNMVNDSYEDSMYPFLPVTHKSGKTSAFLRRILQESNDYENIGNDILPSSSNRTKSISEDTFSIDESNDILRKLSLSQSIGTGQNNNKKSPFLSKFLNDLENREQNASINNSSLNHRRYLSNSFSSGKRSKSEKRSKSFLQLLSLKRIQEAEKELDKAERNPVIDAEEESAGSLLEALKTHGYKGVISQLFQGTDNNSLDTLNVPSSKSPFLTRKLDISRYSPLYYDTLPQFSSPTYDISDLDPYETYPSIYKQNSPKQFVCDWLTTTQNLEYKTPFSFEADVPEEEYPIGDATNLNWGKETSKLDDRALTSESPEASNDQFISDSIVNETSKKYSITEYSDPLSYPKTEKNSLVRASSTSEDEREESVQDRIWRKSFYSRFNNSALSRKERSSFLESEFSPESRAGINGLSPSPFKTTHRESVKWNKDIQSKRVHTARKYSLMKDSSVASCETKLSKPSKQNSYENISSNESLSHSKFDDLEPDH